MITLTRERKEELVQRLQRYFEEHLEQELGRFDAEFLLDFFMEHLGYEIYNQALHDTNAKLMQHFEAMGDLLYTLELFPPKKT